MSRRIAIVGGVAGGATAAARARRLDETAEIVVFERGSDVSFANCGLPYHIGGEIPNRDALLVQTKKGLMDRFNLDIRTRTEVVGINREKREITARDLETGAEYQLAYDYLVLSPGAKPFVPAIPGTDLPDVFTLRDLNDMDRIKARVDKGAKDAVVVGGGFIGLEMAENLKRRGLSVSVIELLPQVMSPLDAEIAYAVQAELVANGITLNLGTSVSALEAADGRLAVVLSDGRSLTTDLVILAVGVQPDSSLARQSGLVVGERGAIVVNKHMQTSDPTIYAVGDAIQVEDSLLGGPTFLPLAGPANRQARIAVNHIFGRQSAYRGAFGTSIVRLFGLTAARTGASEALLKQKGVSFRKVYVHHPHHVSYYPGAQQMTIKLLFAPETGKLLGAQIVGRAGVDKRIDVLAAALFAGLSVFDLEELELAYSPQFGAAKDPINIAGDVAVNMLTGAEEFVFAEELTEANLENWTVIDVQEPDEFEAAHIRTALNIPLHSLRSRWQEIPRDKQIVVYCAVGQRAYYATRVLRHNGVKVFNLAGGYTTYKLFHPEKSSLTQVLPAEKQEPQFSTLRSYGDRESQKELLDLRGLPCPGPIARLSAKAKVAAPGTVFDVLASDPGFASDVKGWCKRNGCSLDRLEERADGTTCEVTIGGSAGPIAVGARSSQKKTIVVFSGDLDRVLAALVIANAAADMNSEVTLFFTFWGLNALRKDGGISPKKPVLDWMFGKMMPRGASALPLSKMHFLGLGTALMKRVMKAKNAPNLPGLLASAKEKGVRFVACSMSMDVMGLKREELMDGIEIGGAASYLAVADEGNVNLFI